PTPALATLPWSLSIVGVAAASLPAALLMQRVGRRPVFVGSALLGAAGALACAAAIAGGSYLAFCLTGLLFGANAAVVQQFRFAAVESVPAPDAARAVATVMLGTLAAAVIGPALGERVRHLGGWPEYTGSFVVLAGLLLCAAAVLARLPADAPVPAQHRDAGRPVRELLRVADYRLALLGALASYAVMSFIMTATPISMHVHDGFDGHATAGVITAHLLGMYLPSLATPWLSGRLGIRGMMLAGLAANFACIGIVAAVGEGFVHYIVALVLLGVGWNLLFVGATAVLAGTHSADERFRAQGFNDLVVFGCQAVASLLAGFALESIGWTALNLAALPLLLVTTWMVLRRGEVTPTR
ncbi:MAG: MFS transporter, partial [Gammaproteobacteria bacterium]